MNRSSVAAGAGAGGRRDVDAETWARTVVRVLRTPFPWSSQHVSSGEDDCDVTPWRLHPAFHGALDWHSSCHMQATGVRLLDGWRDLIDDDTATALVAELDARLTVANAEVEARYLRDHPGFERPYGWAWAAELAAVTSASTHQSSGAWSAAALVVARAAADSLVAWLPKLVYPVRTGQHDNTAFGLLVARRAFVDLGWSDTVAVIDDHARRLFLADTAYPSRYEPSGNDFLSAALCQAELMRDVLAEAFDPWLQTFLPDLGTSEDVLLRVPAVQDLSDGKLVHLFGLALSRARSLRVLAPSLDEERAGRMRTAADAQVAAVAPQIDGGHFMSTHWLVTFALRAATA